ncbi:rho guanine nucleotide exchange factor 11-like [Tachypleus tridentatus]|uniref:rho guanine nucleotide exchange factor 11-like n=1 Tax=Tachypleus tridentatus TaxID=6853 RepID=UPI003FD436B4
MVHKTPGGTPADSVPGFVPSTGPLPSSGSSLSSHVHQFDDSDLEAENDPPRWQENVNINVLHLMKPEEKKRQDVINELFHTERTHVRNLKVLDRLFFKPMQQEQLLPSDQLYLLFPNLEEMLEIHSRFNNKMKAHRREQPVVGDVGDIMLEMLDGSSGKEIKSAAAKFCRNQSIALEALKNKQKKEQKLAQFLSDAEANHLCRRLQLKDIIATGFQRLTKYPLLLENIAKYTPQNSEEHRRLLQAVHCSKQILAHVNQAVNESENEHRLGELQKKMNRSAFEKVKAPIVQAYHHLDLMKHKLIHEGPLTWRLHKQKTIEMHVVLLEDILVLLQKQNDKLLLKFHNNNLMSGREDTKVTHSPILRVQNLFTRNVATGKLYLLSVFLFIKYADHLETKITNVVNLCS